MPIDKNIIKQEPLTINNLIKLLNQIDLELIEVMKVTAEFKWNPYEDSREILKINIHEKTLLAVFTLSMLAETINIYDKKEWWAERLPHLKKHFDSDSNIDFQKFVFNRQNKILNREKDNLLFDTFHEFETKIRNIIRILGNVPDPSNPKRFLNGTEKLYQLRKGLLENYLELEEEDSKLVEFLQEIRNSIHNSGIFYSYNKQDKEITYKDTVYKFSHGFPINFTSWKFTQLVIIDLIKLIKKILTHDLITKVDRIEDPVAKIKWEK